jgi:hypothetical protein
MGRIADRMGFKYGWNGLWRQVGSGNDVYGNLLVTRDARDIFAFLGYDGEMFEMGFIDYENMFQFATSTPYFHRAPYQFENRNHRDRIRDEKRTTYQALVAWLEDKPWLDKHTWASYDLGTVNPLREREKEKHLQRAFRRFPDFHQRYKEAQGQRELEIAAKEKWNGGIVGVITGLSGKALGGFMEKCREEHRKRSVYQFEYWVTITRPQEIEAFVKEVQRELESRTSV